MNTTTTSVTLAALLPLGGIAAFMRKGSKPSLVAGCVLGAMYAYAFVQLNGALPASSTARTGNAAGLLASAVLLAAMLVRLVAARKMMPLVLSVVGALATAQFYIAL